jgi:hypothetical protein
VLHDVCGDALSTLGGLKLRVQGHPDFLLSKKLKALYVVIATTETAIIHNDLEELAFLCADFVGGHTEPPDGDGHPFRVVGS